MRSMGASPGAPSLGHSPSTALRAVPLPLRVRRRDLAVDPFFSSASVRPCLAGGPTSAPSGQGYQPDPPGMAAPGGTRSHGGM
jgi:hypothetical protein